MAGSSCVDRLSTCRGDDQGLETYSSSCTAQTSLSRWQLPANTFAAPPASDIERGSIVGAGSAMHRLQPGPGTKSGWIPALSRNGEAMPDSRGGPECQAVAESGRVPVRRETS